MADITYRCHHCGSTHEAESIRENFYLDRRPIASYPAAGPGVLSLRTLLLRWRIIRGVASGLWPRYPHQEKQA
jgi:hypothetical protein